MNNKVNKSFLLRHKEGALLDNGMHMYEEDFYINQQRPAVTNRSMLHVFAYGESLWRQGYQLKRNCSGEWWSFEYIVDGGLDFIYNKVCYKAKPGDLVILRPQQASSMRPGIEGFVQKKCMLLESPLIHYMCENGNLAGIHCVSTGKSLRVTTVFDTIKTMILTDNNYLLQDFAVQAYALLAELSQCALPRQYPAALRLVLDKIDAFPYCDYSLRELSREFNVSESTLSRLFRKYLNTSPMNYIIDRRLEQAKLLINISDMVLKEVAEKCGYKSVSFFSRAFKKKFGVSPASCRQRW